MTWRRTVLFATATIAVGLVFLPLSALLFKSLGALGWAIMRDLPQPLSGIVALSLALGLAVALPALVIRRLSVRFRWLLLVTTGLGVATIPLMLHALLGSWSAQLYLPGGKSSPGYWTTVDDMMWEPVLVGGVMILSGITGFVFFTLKSKPKANPIQE